LSRFLKGMVAASAARTIAKVKKLKDARSMAKKKTPPKRKEAATPKGKSAGTKDYVPAKDRVAPLQRALTKAEEKSLTKLQKEGATMRKKANASARRRMMELKVKTTVTHPGIQAGAATAGLAAYGATKKKDEK